MTIDFSVAVPDSPEWWLNHLLTKMEAVEPEPWSDPRIPRYGRFTRRQRLNMLWAYNTGNAPLPQVAEAYTDVFRDVMRKARCNYAPMCVTAMLDRLELRGIATAVDKSLNADDTANEIADVSNLGAELKDMFEYTLALRESYALIVPPTDDSPVQVPVIKALDPRNAIGEPDPFNPMMLRAFLHRTWDPVKNLERVELYLPGKRYTVEGSTMAWEWSGEAEDVVGIDQWGGVPVVRMENAKGLGEFEPHIDLLDRINDTTLQRIVITWYQSFRQRAVIGDLEDTSEDDDSDAEEIDWSSIFSADPGALWRVPKDTTFWESNQADLNQIIAAKRDDVKEFSAVTGTPIYLFTPDAANGSAEGASLLREALKYKVTDRRARFTPALKLMWKIAFAFAKQPDRGRDIQLLWGSIESNSLADRGSATAQAQGVLSKERILVTIWDMSPAEAQQNMTELTADRLLDDSASPNTASV